MNIAKVYSKRKLPFLQYVNFILKISQQWRCRFCFDRFGFSGEVVGLHGWCVCPCARCVFADCFAYAGRTGRQVAYHNPRPLTVPRHPHLPLHRHCLTTCRRTNQTVRSRRVCKLSFSLLTPVLVLFGLLRLHISFWGCCFSSVFVVVLFFSVCPYHHHAYVTHMCIFYFVSFPFALIQLVLFCGVHANLPTLNLFPFHHM